MPVNIIVLMEEPITNYRREVGSGILTVNPEPLNGNAGGGESICIVIYAVGIVIESREQRA
jgi:hypothetical protein